MNISKKCSNPNRIEHYFSDEIISVENKTYATPVSHYYHQDSLRSVRKITDNSGDVQSTYDYDIFGTMTVCDGSIDNDYTFTGRRKDNESGLMYYRARYYNPETGRFMTQDSVEGNPLNPASLNKYVYCVNNPINYIDPSGHWSEDDDSDYDSGWEDEWWDHDNWWYRDEVYNDDFDMDRISIDIPDSEFKYNINYESNRNFTNIYSDINSSINYMFDNYYSGIVDSDRLKESTIIPERSENEIMRFESERVFDKIDFTYGINDKTHENNSNKLPQINENDISQQNFNRYSIGNKNDIKISNEITLLNLFFFSNKLKVGQNFENEKNYDVFLSSYSSIEFKNGFPIYRRGATLGEKDINVKAFFASNGNFTIDSKVYNYPSLGFKIGKLGISSTFKLPVGKKHFIKSTTTIHWPTFFVPYAAQYFNPQQTNEFVRQFSTYIKNIPNNIAGWIY